MVQRGLPPTQHQRYWLWSDSHVILNTYKYILANWTINSSTAIGFEPNWNMLLLENFVSLLEGMNDEVMQNTFRSPVMKAEFTLVKSLKCWPRQPLDYSQFGGKLIVSFYGLMCKWITSSLMRLDCFIPTIIQNPGDSFDRNILIPLIQVVFYLKLHCLLCPPFCGSSTRISPAEIHDTSVFLGPPPVQTAPSTNWRRRALGRQTYLEWICVFQMRQP